MSDEVKPQVYAILRVLHGVSVIIVAGVIAYVASALQEVTKSQAVTASQTTIIAATLSQVQAQTNKNSSDIARQSSAVDDWNAFKRRVLDGSYKGIP